MTGVSSQRISEFSDEMAKVGEEEVGAPFQRETEPRVPHPFPLLPSSVNIFPFCSPKFQ